MNSVATIIPVHTYNDLVINAISSAVNQDYVKNRVYVVLNTTEKNLQEVIKRVKDMQGSFVVYALDPKSFESLAINMEQIKLYIEQQKQIILYYEKAVKNEKEN